MAVPRSTIGRIVAIVFVIWLVVSVVLLVRFHAGGSVPADGRGERIELSNRS